MRPQLEGIVAATGRKTRPVKVCKGHTEPAVEDGHRWMEELWND